MVEVQLANLVKQVVAGAKSSAGAGKITSGSGATTTTQGLVNNHLFNASMGALPAGMEAMGVTGTMVLILNSFVAPRGIKANNAPRMASELNSVRASFL